jgi:hypothetical protein
MDAFTPLDPPGRDATDYFRKFDIAALVIFAPAPAAPCQPAATLDVAEALKRTQKIWPKEEPPLLAHAWWVSGIRPAQQVLTLSLACDLRGVSFERNRLAAPLDVVAAALAAAAGRLGIALTDYQIGLDRVGAATATLEGQLDTAQAAGLLAPFNIEFRRRRQLAEQNGGRFMSYRQARRRLIALLGHAAARGQFDAEILRQVFETDR